MKTLYQIQDREAGNAIETYETLVEAQAALSRSESDDKCEGVYAPNFYEIVEVSKGHLKNNLQNLMHSAQNTQAFLAIREERLNKICADYRKFIKTYVQDEHNGRDSKASVALGENAGYIRDVLRRGGVIALKGCAEKIGRICV